MRRRSAGRPRGATIAPQVLRETLAELARAGLEGLSVARIAERAKVNKTSIYRRWPTREALVAAALNGVRQEVAARAPDTGSLRGDLVALLAPVGRLLSTPNGQALVRASFSETMGNELSALSSRHVGRRLRGPVRGLVERARTRGELGPAVNVRQLLCTLQGALIHRVLFERANVTNRWLEATVDLVIEGARPRT